MTEIKLAARPFTDWGFEFFPEDSDDQWQDFLEDLEQELCDIFDLTDLSDGHFHGVVENFGWMKQSGVAQWTAKTPEEFLRGFLPKTDCHFQMFKYLDGPGIAVQNFHHDSPTGNEWYYITCTKEEE